MVFIFSWVCHIFLCEISGTFCGERFLSTPKEGVVVVVVPALISFRDIDPQASVNSGKDPLQAPFSPFLNLFRVS